MIMRNKRGRDMEWANPTKAVSTPVPPLHAIASPWQPLRHWRGLGFKGLIRVSPRGTLSHRLIGRFTSPLIG